MDFDLLFKHPLAQSAGRDKVEKWERAFQRLHRVQRSGSIGSSPAMGSADLDSPS